jgi:hypothetical protein
MIGCLQCCENSMLHLWQPSRVLHMLQVAAVVQGWSQQQQQVL